MSLPTHNTIDKTESAYKTITKIALLWIGLFFIILCHACQKELKNIKELSQNAPLNEQQFMLILTDMHTAQAIKQTTTAQNDTLLHNTLPEYYAQVLCLHQVSADDFEQSFTYYMAQPERINKIYELVLSQYNYLEAELKKQADKEPKHDQPKPDDPKPSLITQSGFSLKNTHIPIRKDSVKLNVAKKIKLQHKNIEK